jgi:hypothetical protein
VNVEQKGSIVFAIDLLARALASDDAASVRVAQQQLAAVFPIRPLFEVVGETVVAPDEPTFALSIGLGNDAMQTPANIAAALRWTAAIVERFPSLGATYGSIRDENGNTVGRFGTRVES